MKIFSLLAAVSVLLAGSAGCANRPLRNILHRGAPCGSEVTAPVTFPVMGETTTYSPSCCTTGGCPSCGTSGMPMIYGGEVPLGSGPLPGPGEEL